MDRTPGDSTANDDTAVVASALDALAPALHPGSRVEDLKRLTGGASLQTWSFALAAPGGSRRLVLRRRPLREDSIFSTSNPLTVEAALIVAAGNAGAPVPGLVRDCGPADGLGEAYIVEHVAGETFGRRIAADPRFEPARCKLADQTGRALAAIHATPLGALPPLKTLDARETLASYEAIHRDIGAARPVLEAAFRRLYRHAPAMGSPRLVHGDFRNGNLIIDPQEGLAAVLDWELTHLGDPAEDFGWLCVNSWRFGVAEREAGGFADLAEVLAAYEAAGGARPPMDRIRYWQMLGSLRWAVICLMMYQSFATGEERTLERAAIGRRLSECEVDLLALMEAA